MKEVIVGQTFEISGRPGPDSRLVIERDIERIRLATRPEVLAVLRDGTFSAVEKSILERLNARAVEPERSVKLAYERAAREDDPPLPMVRVLINLQIAQACLGIEVEPSDWGSGKIWRIVNTNVEVVPAITRELTGMHKELAGRQESTRSDAAKDLFGTLVNKYSGAPEEDFAPFPSIQQYATGLEGLVNNCNQFNFEKVDISIIRRYGRLFLGRKSGRLPILNPSPKKPEEEVARLLKRLEMKTEELQLATAIGAATHARLRELQEEFRALKTGRPPGAAPRKQPDGGNGAGYTLETLASFHGSLPEFRQATISVLNRIYGKRKTVVRLEIERFLEALRRINCPSVREPLQDYISLVERGLARAHERGIAQIARIEIRLGN